MSTAVGLGYKTSKPIPTTLPPVRLCFLKIPQPFQQLHQLKAGHSKNVTLTYLTGVRLMETTSGRYADIIRFACSFYKATPSVSIPACPPQHREPALVATAHCSRYSSSVWPPSSLLPGLVRGRSQGCGHTPCPLLWRQQRQFQ